MPPRKRQPKTPQPQATVTSIQPTAPASNAFVLADELDELSYDFRPYVDAYGIVPEPSSKAIRKYQQALAKVVASAQEIALNTKNLDDAAQTATALSMLSSDDDEFVEAMLDATAILCSQHPSREEIAALPFRGQQAFAGWLSGKFLNPEA